MADLTDCDLLGLALCLSSGRNLKSVADSNVPADAKHKKNQERLSMELTYQLSKPIRSVDTFGWLGAVFVATVTLILSPPSHGQDISVTQQVRHAGTIRDRQPGQLSILTNENKIIACKVQDKNERAISIGGTAVNVPATIKVTGSLPISLVERGMIVQFTGRANANGKCEGEMSEIKVLNDSSADLAADFIERPEPGEAAKIEITGRVMNLIKNKLQLQVPKSNWAKRERIEFTVAENCKLLITDDDLSFVRPGDQVTDALVLEMSSGENVIRQLNVTLSPDRQRMTTTYEDQLQQKFSDLSNEPTDPRTFFLPNGNFILYTDLSDQQANILMAKLETMHGLIGNYFGKRPRIPIECYVIADLSKWRKEPLDPIGVAKIREPAGVTISKPLPGTKEVKAIVYSCDQHGVCQHEAVHAFCAQAFGSTGPVWYSEGMAEMGQYWKPGELAVNIDPVVIDYLTNAEPKKMADIIAAGQITGDSWQAYAWRWALCHLLASNPNYARRFKKLGLNMMSGGNDSFELAFGSVAPNISFEYDQFVQNFGNGYRVDLCSWDWSVTPKKLSGSGKLSHKIKAAAGWQPTKLMAEKGDHYDFVTTGKWQTAGVGEPVSAAGDSAGNGKLVGMLLNDFKIEGPFEMGEKGSFIAPSDGQLYVRCMDGWTELADNEGEIELFLRRTPKE